MSTHGLLCPSRAVCLHTDCCARVERYVYTPTVVPEKSGMSTLGLLCPSRAVCLPCRSSRAQQVVCRHTSLLGHNSPFVEIPLYSGTTVRVLKITLSYVYTRTVVSEKSGTSTHGLLCPSRAVCLHTDCCARVERYVYTRTVVPE
jgi:hypothetical protein